MRTSVRYPLPMARRSVTDEQILYAILAEVGDQGQLPGIRQVAKRLGMSPSAIHRRVGKLEEKDLVVVRDGIRVLPEVIPYLTGPKTGRASLDYVWGPAGLILCSSGSAAEPF